MIVLMRKHVKQARVHMVRKLVRKAEALRKKKGTDEMKQKFERKADRLVEEILTLKKLKDDDISKFAILGSQLHADAPLSASHIRILTKISMHKLLENKVEKFRNKWPDWRETVPRVLNSPAPETELVSSTGNSKALKVKRELNGKVNQKLQIYKKNVGEILVQKNNFKTMSGTKEDSLHGAQKRKKVSSKVPDKSDQIIGKMNFRTEARNGKMKAKRKKQKNSALVQAEDSIVSNESAEDENDLLHHTSSPVPAVARDPFFMESEDAHVKNAVKFEQLKNTHVNHDGLNRHQRRLALHISAAKDKKNIKVQNNVKNKATKQPFGHNRLKKDRLHDAVEDISSLHPSWEAKKRLQAQQGLSIPFQGKKIKFEED